MILLSIGMVALGAAILVIMAVRTGAIASLNAPDARANEGSADWPRRDVLPDERTAAHEAGHAIVAWISPSVVRIKTVTLDGPDGGVVSFDRTEIRDATHRWDSIAISLAGIAGEGRAFGCVRAYGCGSDLRRARAWAEQLCEEGDPMSSYPWPAAKSETTLDIGAMFADRPSPSVCAVLNKAYRRSKDIVGLRPDKFDALRRMLLERRTLTPEEVETALGPRPWARR